MVRSILGAVSEFEKFSLVAKLKAARVRKKKEAGRCEGRKSVIEKNPQLLNDARRLRRKNRSTGKRMSYERVAKELFAMGYMTGTGKPYKREFVYKILNS